MRRRAEITLVGAAIAVAIALAGCGEQPASGPQTQVVVSRDFGSRVVLPTKSVPHSAGLTAMRQLQRSSDVETTYGGRYANSINGLKGDGGSEWLFFVDGEESEKAATDWRLTGGELVQWDFHRWQDVKTSGAIVGAFPRPLKARGVKMICLPKGTESCNAAGSSLSAQGISTEAKSSDAPLVYVGEWSAIAGEERVPRLDEAAADNGAFASFGKNGSTLSIISDDGRVERKLGRGAGLVAADRDQKDLTWLVTGVDQAGTLAAAQGLNQESLRHRFAVAFSPSGAITLPVTDSEKTDRK